jgi:glycerol-3-phosphate dehydrogenase
LHRQLGSLGSEQFDVLIIGGGITGAWIALDCAQRGLQVALIEQQDFGAGTSAKSSKLIHGGIRYLQQLRFDKVRESAMERAYYHRAAPHLTHFLPFVIPTYRSFSKSKAFMLAGLGAYRLLCAGENRITGDNAKKMPPSYCLNRRETLEILPLSDPTITGSVVYFESHMHSSERMTLAVLEHASQDGAICANYVAAKRPILSDDGQVLGIIAQDMISGQQFDIRAQMTVNAAGPWVPGLHHQLFDDNASTATTGYSRGSHLVTRQLIKNHAVALTTEYAGQNLVDRGGRHIFIIPWRGYSLIGTSYISTNDIDDPIINREEVDQLLDAINHQLPSADLTCRDILHTYSGIYPLQEIKLDAKKFQGSGDYQIIDHAQTGHRGIITALGAKYTTARMVGEKVTDKVCRQLAAGSLSKPTDQQPPLKHAKRTRQIRLASAQYTDLHQYRADQSRRLQGLLSAPQVERLISLYGSDIEKLAQCMEQTPSMAQPLCDNRPNLKVEIQYAVQSEMALRLDDVIYRRTGMGTIGNPGSECINTCADIMAELLDWNTQRRSTEIASLESYQRGANIQ